ncbi:tetraacyldisaccharide 4'-kinase [Synergistes jonesii]|uniref:tetraacyldisaccharide 4'-kinase n=1 Tax=Synergistes jonesii TaxID=2754 RepID=UPI003333657E
MSKLLRSYLRYVRGESGLSPWSVLYPCQLIASAWMRLRIELFNRGIFSVTDPALPTVSIGNNSFGGTNKTPVAEYIVRQFAESGIRAGVVSRGYRTKEHPPLWIGQDEKSTGRDFAGDEPLMLAKRLPNAKIVVSRNRLEGVKLLAALGAEVAVTDDTFQHRKMARDVDIVLVDSTCPFGNGNIIPAGLMREPMSAFRRADIVVLTKANQTTPEAVAAIKKKLAPYVSEDKIFTADIKLDRWLSISAGDEKKLPRDFSPRGRYIALSAIGNPEGFYSFLGELGVELAGRRTFRDHHFLTEEDVAELENFAGEVGADGFVCTEKDLTNIPHGLFFDRPLYVPSISVAIRDSLAFRRKIAERLRPSFLVASNGHGEDAIGVVLAKKLAERFRCAKIDAFTFVGSGKPYEESGIRVVSPPADMPSGGVVKYHIGDFLRDVRCGLGVAIKEQRDAMRGFIGSYRTPLCVGDVYLASSVLWGQGMKPLLVATAKTIHLSGHLWIEKLFLRRRCVLVFTRDEETAKELAAGGVPAVFYGNPIMDLLDEAKAPAFAWDERGAKVLLLPGSRPRAYEDVKLILDAAALLSRRIECSFVMVPAPTIEIKKLAENLSGWTLSEDMSRLSSGDATVNICREPVAAAAYGAELLIGLGGTANQLCAGIGIPVVSIIERGKLRQKKLLRDAEILVPPTAEELSSAAFRVLSNSGLRRFMQEAGIKNLGRTGALERVTEYCAKELGWETRCRVYEKYTKYLDAIDDKKGAVNDGR